MADAVFYLARLGIPRKSKGRDILCPGLARTTVVTAVTLMDVTAS